MAERNQVAVVQPDQSPRVAPGPAAPSGSEPTTGDMLNALERCIARLDHEADTLGNAGDYACEFPASDAEALRAVLKLLGGNRETRVQFQRAPDPMEVPLPCHVKIGHMGFGKGVPLRLLVEHMKRMYRLVHGQDADEVANEPMEARRARGDAFLAGIQTGMSYRDDYPTEPIGGGNPYHRCAACGRSVPDINGRIERHNPWCSWRQQQEKSAAGTSTRTPVFHPPRRGTDDC